MILLFKAVDVLDRRLRERMLNKDSNSQLVQFIPILGKIFMQN